MEQQIREALLQLEQDRGIKILYACETGSRAWGFPSPDSDYDIRLIYKHDRDWYLSLTEKKDTIELMLANNELDITGWDIRKSLRLLKKSNVSMLERLQSPQVYLGDETFIMEFSNLATQCYSRVAAIHHYLNLARRFFEEIHNQEKYKLKSFFYALRTSVACEWILSREDMPPIEFLKMLEFLPFDSRKARRIEELINLKAGKSEAYRHNGEEELLDYMKEIINRSANLGRKLPGAKFDHKGMDEFFRKTILNNDN